MAQNYILPFFFSVVTCPVPTTPGNGRVTGCLYRGSPQGIDGRQKYSTACSMVCSQGFTKTGGSARRVCQADGQWDGQQIVCEGDLAGQNCYVFFFVFSFFNKLCFTSKIINMLCY